MPRRGPETPAGRAGKLYSPKWSACLVGRVGLDTKGSVLPESDEGRIEESAKTDRGAARVTPGWVKMTARERPFVRPFRLMAVSFIPSPPVGIENVT